MSMMGNEGTPQFKTIKTHLPKQSFCVPEEIVEEIFSRLPVNSLVEEIFSRLPVNSLVEEIFSRLPVNSLLKFRCVSKPWRFLIDSKRFIKKHLHTWTENPNFAHHEIIFDSIGSQLGLKQCSLLSMLNEPLTDQFTVCDLENINAEVIRIVGCCNGLVCLLLDHNDFLLWNPSTRKTKKLPDMDGRIIEFAYIKNYGLGYDDLSGDYMVYGVASMYLSGGIYETIYKVYSLQRNSWKKVKRGIPPPFDSQGKFASGKLHWGSFSHMGWNIVSFNLRSEVYDTIELPYSYKEFDNKSIGVVGGRLSLIWNCFSHLDIWILKQYGVKESWEKAATLPHLHTTVRSPYESLLAVGPNGEILLTGRSSFGIYYPEGDGFRHCQVRGHGMFPDAVVYVESLVPLQ